MKSLMLFLSCVLDDIGNRCCISTRFDKKTIESRFKDEGLSFLTITLPTFGKDLQKGLDQGLVTPDMFSSFRKRAGLPLFLGGFLELIFDRASGILLENPSVDAIYSVRQLTLMFQKIEMECTRARNLAALRNYLQCESDVRDADIRVFSDEDLLESFHRMSRMLFGNLFAKVDHMVYNSQVIMRHGPGTTADGLLGNKKWHQREWTERLENILPFGENCLPSWSYFDTAQTVLYREPGSERPVQVLLVPKTLKTPRIIAREPTAMQYAQQGIWILIRDEVERSDTLRPLIGFLDQTPNQRLAKEGSIYGDLATLDMKEASDRVSNQLVRLMLSDHPFLAEAVDASRSRKADVPDHGVIRLAKFASMGSALCFPFEAMVFLTVVLLGIEQSSRSTLRPKHIRALNRLVRVFGDDVIVPSHYVPEVTRLLTTFGLKVNTDKSYWTGKFRESCGKDYYDGDDVTVVRMRRVFPASLQDAEEIASTVSLRNQLYLAGMWGSVRWLDNYLERLIPFPAVLADSPVLGKTSFLGYEIQRVGSRYQTSLVRGARIRAVLPRNSVDGHDALHKWFTLRGSEPLERDHLERSGRAKSVSIKIGWSQPF